MLILDVFSETSSFGLETNRISSSDIDLKKIKTLETLKEVPIFFPVELKMHQSRCKELS